jgi:hypothetical protein
MRAEEQVPTREGSRFEAVSDPNQHLAVAEELRASGRQGTECVVRGGRKVNWEGGKAIIDTKKLPFRSSGHCQPVSSRCRGIVHKDESGNEGFV